MQAAIPEMTALTKKKEIQPPCTWAAREAGELFKPSLFFPTRSLSSQLGPRQCIQTFRARLASPPKRTAIRSASAGFQGQGRGRLFPRERSQLGNGGLRVARRSGSGLRTTTAKKSAWCLVRSWAGPDEPADKEAFNTPPKTINEKNIGKECTPLIYHWCQLNNPMPKKLNV